MLLFRDGALVSEHSSRDVGAIPRVLGTQRYNYDPMVEVSVIECAAWAEVIHPSGLENWPVRDVAVVRVQAHIGFVERVGNSFFRTPGQGCVGVRDIFFDGSLQLLQ